MCVKKFVSENSILNILIYAVLHKINSKKLLIADWSRGYLARLMTWRRLFKSNICKLRIWRNGRRGSFKSC